MTRVPHTVTHGAQRDQVHFGIISRMAAKFLVVHLQV
jgi:hypothetical protein